MNDQTYGNKAWAHTVARNMRLLRAEKDWSLEHLAKRPDRIKLNRMQ